MAAKLARLTNKVVIQLHLVEESYTICSSRARRPVRKLLDTPSYFPNASTSRTVSNQYVDLNENWVLYSLCEW
jgi:hypothetical protein